MATEKDLKNTHRSDFKRNNYKCLIYTFSQHNDTSETFPSVSWCMYLAFTTKKRNNEVWFYSVVFKEKLFRKQNKSLCACAFVHACFVVFCFVF